MIEMIGMIGMIEMTQMTVLLWISAAGGLGFLILSAWLGWNLFWFWYEDRQQARNLARNLNSWERQTDRQHGRQMRQMSLADSRQCAGSGSKGGDDWEFTELEDDETWPLM